MPDVRPHQQGASQFLPPGFNTVTPYFFVSDAPAFIAFLTDGLDGVEIGRHMRDGRVANAQVRLGTQPSWSARPPNSSRHVRVVLPTSVAMTQRRATVVLAVATCPTATGRAGFGQTRQHLVALATPAAWLVRNVIAAGRSSKGANAA